MQAVPAISWTASLWIVRVEGPIARDAGRRDDAFAVSPTGVSTKLASVRRNPQCLFLSGTRSALSMPSPCSRAALPWSNFDDKDSLEMKVNPSVMRWWMIAWPTPLTSPPWCAPPVVHRLLTFRGGGSSADAEPTYARGAALPIGNYASAGRMA